MEEKNAHIPTSEIEQDIEITQSEIKQLESELLALRGNPVDNKLQIYLREGKILKRKEFVSALQEILDYRNSATNKMNA